MKKLLTSSLFILASSFLVAKAELLYFMADAYDPQKWLYFDYAMIGVAQYDGEEWNLEWGEGGTSKMYLHLYDSANATIGGSSAAATETQVAANISDYTSGSDATRFLSVGWADVSDYMTSDYRFYVETYSNDKDDPVMTCFDGEAKTYSELLKAGHIYAPSLTNPQDVTPWTVPEPSSALLVLVGAGLAAWRRRRARCAPVLRRTSLRVGRAQNERSRDARRETRTVLFTSSLFLLASPFLSAFAGADDMLVSFSTKGPDTYLDGTAVKDGECYALVWTRAGASFEGLAADGTAVGTNSRVVVFAPVAKSGRCPPVLFELDAELAKSYTGGAFAVYLLDTRLASGAVGGVKANGFPVAVNGWGSVDATSSSRQNEDETSSDGRGEDAASTGSTSTGARIAVTSRSALPADTPQPTITAIRLVGDNVLLTVKGTLPCLKYKAVDASLSRTVDATSSSRQNEDETSFDGRGEDAASTGAAQGAASPDGEITIIVPKKGDSGLYSVGRD